MILRWKHIIFKYQIPWCRVGVLFFSLYFLNAEDTVVELIWYPAWLISELFSPLKLQCCSALLEHTSNWQMWEELLLSWLSWLLLCRPSSMSCSLRCHVYVKRVELLYVTDMEKDCGLKCLSVSCTQHCPPTPTLLPFQHLLWKHVGCFQLHISHNSSFLGGDTDYMQKEKYCQGCQDGRSAAEHWPRSSSAFCNLLTDLHHRRKKKSLNQDLLFESVSLLPFSASYTVCIVPENVQIGYLYMWVVEFCPKIIFIFHLEMVRILLQNYFRGKKV